MIGLPCGHVKRMSSSRHSFTRCSISSFDIRWCALTAPRQAIRSMTCAARSEKFFCREPASPPAATSAASALDDLPRQDRRVDVGEQRRDLPDDEGRGAERLDPKPQAVQVVQALAHPGRLGGRDLDVRGNQKGLALHPPGVRLLRQPREQDPLVGRVLIHDEQAGRVLQEDERPVKLADDPDVGKQVFGRGGVQKGEGRPIGDCLGGRLGRMRGRRPGGARRDPPHSARPSPPPLRRPAGRRRSRTSSSPDARFPPPPPRNPAGRRAASGDRPLRPAGVPRRRARTIPFPPRGGCPRRRRRL